MGILKSVKSQFLDIIEFIDPSNKIIVIKYIRPSGDDEIKQGSKVIVREGQNAVFLKGGIVADVFEPGTYELNTDNLPILSSLNAFGSLFHSAIISDLYFVSTKQFLDNNWATKNPVMKRDKDLKYVRIRGFGKYSFQITDTLLFMKKVVGALGFTLTYDIVQYLASLVFESFSTVMGKSDISVMDIASSYRIIANEVKKVVNEQTNLLGITINNIVIENISLPDDVEKMIDEQSGIGMASQNMENFIQYQSARAIRDAAKQNNGLAGIGVGIEAGKSIATAMKSETTTSKSMVEELKDYKKLLDDGVLTQSEFNELKHKLLNGK